MSVHLPASFRQAQSSPTGMPNRILSESSAEDRRDYKVNLLNNFGGNPENSFGDSENLLKRPVAQNSVMSSEENAASPSAKKVKIEDRFNEKS